MTETGTSGGRKHRRAEIKMTAEEVEGFLHEVRAMTMCSMNHDGTIHAVAMWYGFVDGLVTVETKAKSQKARNLSRDPRLTCLFEAGEAYDELRGVELVGQGGDRRRPRASLDARGRRLRPLSGRVHRGDATPGRGDAAQSGGHHAARRANGELGPPQARDVRILAGLRSRFGSGRARSGDPIAPGGGPGHEPEGLLEAAGAPSALRPPGRTPAPRRGVDRRLRSGRRRARVRPSLRRAAVLTLAPFSPRRWPRRRSPAGRTVVRLSPVVTGWGSNLPSVGPTGRRPPSAGAGRAVKRSGRARSPSSPSPAGGRGVTPRRLFVLSNAMDAGPTPWTPGRRNGRRANAMDAGPTHARRANAMDAGPTPCTPGQRNARRANAMDAGPRQWTPGQRNGRRANAMDAGPTPWTPGQPDGRRERDRTPNEFPRRLEADEPGPTGSGEDGQVGRPPRRRRSGSPATSIGRRRIPPCHICRAVSSLHATRKRSVSDLDGRASE